ncbi:MAG: 23S rRNA (guanosine(2251)-2'-O)-methyltransferase RlmB [Pseudomonadota bacterium]
MAEPVFGLHAVDALLRQRPADVQTLWVQSGRTDKRIKAILELASNQGVSVQQMSRAALDEKVSGRHQGVIALVSGSAAGWDEARLLEHLQALEHPPLLLVLDGVTDPHNLGACLRSADAAGVDAVIVPRDKSADLNPTVRKVACGAAESVPFVRVTNLARCLAALKDAGVWLFGAAGEADTLLYDIDLTGPAALVMGAEGSGLRRLTREACDALMRLPMAGDVSSLNVSVAAGICLFEAVRQRR